MISIKNSVPILNEMLTIITSFIKLQEVINFLKIKNTFRKDLTYNILLCIGYPGIGQVTVGKNINGLNK